MSSNKFFKKSAKQILWPEDATHTFLNNETKERVQCIDRACVEFFQIIQFGICIDFATKIPIL